MNTEVGLAAEVGRALLRAEVGGPTLASIAGIQTGVVSGTVKRADLVRPDVAVISTPVPAAFAAVTTTSTAAAAPCIWTRARVPGMLRAVVVNSGNANAATGEQGVRDTEAMAQAVADVLGCDADSVLVCSTGVIGVPMPMHRVLPAVADASRRAANGEPSEYDVAAAILTTDLVRKESGAVHGGISVAGVAKGSGMIHPGMATMLGFAATDAAVDPADLQDLLAAACDVTFNQISVDGDMSTNDTLILIATGAGPVVERGTPAWDDLVCGVVHVCRDLARQIARDGEGARTLVTVALHGAENDVTARRLARAVIQSSLVKAAVHGCDPNWGRIVGALGHAGAIGLDQLDVDLGGVPVMRRGSPIPFDEPTASAAMGAADLTIRLTLPGNGHGIAWGCDLSAQYVAINADYRS